MPIWMEREYWIKIVLFPSTHLPLGKLFSGTIAGLVRCSYSVRFRKSATVPHEQLGCNNARCVRATDKSICVRKYT